MSESTAAETSPEAHAAEIAEKLEAPAAAEETGAALKEEVAAEVAP